MKKIMGSEIVRKLATIQKITSITPIPEANRIVCAGVLGWTVVVGVDEFKVGDLAVFCEVDSFLPVKPEYEFLRKNCYKKYQDGEVLREGFRLRSCKLKKQLSQGLLLPIEKVLSPASDPSAYNEGDDVTEILGIIKYDPPVSANIQGKAKGNFPSWGRKTDEERLQNLWGKAKNNWGNLTFEITTKIDGSSCSIYLKNEYFGVCSRNLDLEFDENNVYWKVAKAQNIKEILKAYGKNIMLQGECFGFGIQDNNEKLDHQEFRVFNIWDIDNQRYFLPAERREFCDKHGILHVPVIDVGKSLLDFHGDIKEALEYADGPSLNPKRSREGVVFKSNEYFEGELVSFKIISNKYLLSQE